MMHRATIIDQLEALKSSLERIDEDERAADRLVIANAYKALHRALSAGSLTPDARKQIKGAICQCAAALSLPEVFA